MELRSNSEGNGEDPKIVPLLPLYFIFFSLFSYFYPL